MNLIKERNPYRGRGKPLVEKYRQYDEEGIKRLLVGHKVTKVADDHLQLDDGTLLKFVGNDGGCVCSAGDYELTELNGVDNIITDVKLFDSGDDDLDDADRIYRIFVFADNQRINLATFEGTDGNGLYGTGYTILVRRPAGEAAGE